MVTANELLKSITNSEAEGHIVIGIDRRIIVPAALKRIAVQYDHNVETVTFDCPRYWDELDMSKMAIYVNYMRSDGYADRYPVTNVTVDNNVMHFNWTISRNVTEVKGVITFLVCVKKTDAEGNEVNHWNSELCQDMFVSEGMETEEQVMDLSSDLVTQLLLRMDSVEQINIQASEMENLLTQTKAAKAETEAARDVALDESDYIKNSYANAIKGEVSGEIVHADDISPIEHDVKCYVHGKNLFDSSDNKTEKDYSTNEQVYSFSTKHLVIGREYTIFSEEPMRWVKISNSITGYSCCGLSNTITGFNSYTFIYNRNPNISDDEELRIYVGNLDRSADTDLTALEAMKICIVEGPVATVYEPYIDPSNTTLVVCGKNLAPEHTFSISGTPMAYGSIGDFVGSVLVRNIPIKPGVTYTISALKPDNITSMTAFLYNGLLSDTVVKHNGCYTAVCVADIGTQIQIPSDGKIANTDGYEFMAITTGNTSGYTEGTPVTISIRKLQIELGESATVFEAYKGSEIAGGLTVTANSVSPFMNIFSKNPGVIIEAEYNRDTTKAMTSYIFTEEIKDEIAAKVEDDMAEVLASLNSYAASLIGGDS